MGSKPMLVRAATAGTNPAAAPNTTVEAGATAAPTDRQPIAGLRRYLVISLVLDVGLPLAGYYVLRGVGLGPGGR